MRRNTARAGWGLVALGLVALAIVVTVGAFRAHSDDAFNRWVGWATIWALVIAALGAVLVLWDKIFPATDDPDQDTGAVAVALAAIVLAEAQDLRSRLIGPGEAADEAANVRFTKSPGRFHEVGGAGEGDLGSVLVYYGSLDPGRLVVLGEPGAGKTVFAVELQVRLLEADGRDSASPVPVLISAAAYDISQSWQDWLAGHLSLRYAIGRETAARLIMGGHILPLVDGLDEMGQAEGNPARASVLISALNAWMRGRQRAPVVVTCRRVEYESFKPGIDRATHVELVPLTADEAARYLGDQFRDSAERQRWEPVLSTLAADPDGSLAGELATPWRLTLALAAYRDDGDPASLIPVALPEQPASALDRELLEQYIDSAVRLHDKAGGYQPADVRRWLTGLADGLAWQAGHGGSATDIELAEWWRPSGRRMTLFVHVMLTALLAAPWIVLAALFHDWWFYFVALGVGTGAAMAARAPSPRRVSFSRLRTGEAVRSFVLALVGGSALGLLLGLGALRLGVTSTWLGDFGFGLGVVLVGWFVLQVSDERPRPVAARDVIRSDGGYLLTSVLGFTVVLGVPGGIALQAGEGSGVLLIGIIFGIAAGATIGLLMGFSGVFGSGSSAWVRYRLTVLLNAAHGRAPLRFGSFLDWGHDAGLLRVSGIAYQFRHRQLQEWLTTPGVVAAPTVVVGPTQDPLSPSGSGPSAG